MKQEIVTRLHKDFESYSQHEDGVEFWYARDLQSLLGYTEWRNFYAVIEKAKTSCLTAKHEVADHFVDVNKVIEAGKGAEHQISDIKLTRYACYLIAQNGDPRKEEIAFAQTYFAVQTRKAEIIQQRLKELRRVEERKNLSKTEKRLAGIVFERGVDSTGFARMKSQGDQVLFGGASTREMKRKLGVPEARPLADFLPTVTVTAKAFANALTEGNVVSKDLKGEKPITTEHKKSNEAVRSAMIERGYRPENLAPAEDIKKIESRLKKQKKALPKGVNKLKK